MHGLTFSCSAINAPSPPNLVNVVISQSNTGIIEISYDLTADNPALVSLHYSVDSDSNWTLVSSEQVEILSDLGENIAPGPDKFIAWPVANIFTGNLAVSTLVDLRVKLQVDDGNLVLSLPGGVPFVLRKIPTGSFTMGSPQGEPGRSAFEGPQHDVSISGFYMGKYEVTQEQWLAVMSIDYGAAGDCALGNTFALGPNYFNPGIHWGDCDLPVEGNYEPVKNIVPADIRQLLNSFKVIDWNGATRFVELLNSLNQGVYSLPTDAQWEYACRAGTNTAFNNGADADPETRDGNLDSVGWFIGNSSGHSQVVGARQANAWSLHDMHGNLHEWCLDDLRIYNAQSVDDPSGPTNTSRRIIRGGSWSSDAVECRSSARLSAPISVSGGNIGFRIAGIGTPIIAEDEQIMAIYNHDLDADHDQLPDGWVQLKLDGQTANPDPDNDGLNNLDEFLNNTDPKNEDSDNDGLKDNFEIANGLNPLNPDIDGDTLKDGLEIGIGTNPLDSDTDDDGFADNIELDQGSNPVLPTAGLSIGWNLISTPLNPEDGTTVDDQLDPAMVSMIWTWIGNRFVPVSINSTENNVLRPGRGYWVYSTDNGFVDFSGNIKQDKTITIDEGWNIIGAFSKGTLAVDYPMVGHLWMWENSSLKCANRLMKMTKGYWVYSMQKATITLP